MAEGGESMATDRTTRRAFLERVVSTIGAAAFVAQAEGHASAEDERQPPPTAGNSADGDWSLECAGWRLSLTKEGDIVSLKNGSTELVDRRLGSSLPRIVAAGETQMDCTRAKVSRREGSKIYFEYQFGDPYP